MVEINHEVRDSVKAVLMDVFRLGFDYGKKEDAPDDCDLAMVMFDAILDALLNHYAEHLEEAKAMVTANETEVEFAPLQTMVRTTTETTEGHSHEVGLAVSVENIQKFNLRCDPAWSERRTEAYKEYAAALAQETIDKNMTRMERMKYLREHGIQVVQD